MKDMTAQSKVNEMIDYGFELPDIAEKSGLSMATIYRARRGGPLHAKSMKAIDKAWGSALAELEEEAYWDSVSY